ncbi:metal dependent phosphohydrolase with a response regulator receiver protein [Agrobacterium albertimagni AOL15]|uniref:Metal dependent phosphohydrolase with a response regulator receiver protein n=1 Tax=Agrobacterium albertimagni AOL15 TaxID=1156935 RepID=K2PL28_9HYPH|nr:HD domain-containing phosphohydrolase [Agrobacterium albertimagni]EKF61648.1 metal dependent phosphohydrolase with a response regulator receiver protein [Agrobacterium albertimagni AOL15]
MRIFAIDGSPSILSFMCQAVSAVDTCEILPFLDPSEALMTMQTLQADLIIVDYNMPGMNGVELILRVRQLSNGRDVPVIMLTSETDPAIKIDAIEAGATEFLTKPIDRTELTIRVRNLLALRIAQKTLASHAQSLERDVASARARIAAQEREIIWRLSKAIACRDGETAQHLERVAIVAGMIAEELGLDSATCELISLASPLHDVGKIGVSDAILLKAGPLDAGEMEQMRAHAAFGAEILGDSASQVIQVAARIAGSHHEKWDGTGYPMQLNGTNIPIEGRIVAVADVFDALCSERPYKKAWQVDAAYGEILKGAGHHFDPGCIAAFDRKWPLIRQLYTRADKAVAAEADLLQIITQTNKTLESAV